MLAIVNVTKDPKQEINDYEIRINSRVIGTFKHARKYNGAAQCLRDAADALDARPLNMDSDQLKMIEILSCSFDRMNDI